MRNPKDILAARVKARNRANAEAMALYPKLKAVFEPLIGQKILKQDGTLLEKIQMPEFDGPLTPANVRVYRTSSHYSLDWTVSVNEPDSECTCVYEEATVYIGEIDGSILRKLGTPRELRTDFTIEDIEQKRAEYKKAKELADNAMSALYPFGEYDR